MNILSALFITMDIRKKGTGIVKKILHQPSKSISQPDFIQDNQVSQCVCLTVSQSVSQSVKGSLAVSQTLCLVLFSIAIFLNQEIVQTGIKQEGSNLSGVSAKCWWEENYINNSISQHAGFPPGLLP